ncbi:MAG: LysR family transcriptional regulator, partial [Stackebrandtia sp.]
MEVELRHLRAVCAVADAGSVSKAAAALGISQPALTAQLRRIEQSLGGAPAGCETKVSDGFSTPFNLWENVGDAPTVS